MWKHRGVLLRRKTGKGEDRLMRRNRGWQMLRLPARRWCSNEAVSNNFVAGDDGGVLDRYGIGDTADDWHKHASAWPDDKFARP